VGFSFKKPFKAVAKAAKAVVKPVRKATRAVDVTAKKSAIRGATRKLDKAVGGKDGWVGAGLVVGGAALAVTGNLALGAALASKGLQTSAAAHATVPGDPASNLTPADVSTVPGDPGAARVELQAAASSRPSSSSSTSSPSSATTSSPQNRGFWSWLKDVFTPRK
jgi:hypothetical protein